MCFKSQFQLRLKKLQKVIIITENNQVENLAPLSEVLTKVRVFSEFREQAITPMERTAIGYLFFTFKTEN